MRILSNRRPQNTRANKYINKTHMNNQKMLNISKLSNIKSQRERTARVHPVKRNAHTLSQKHAQTHTHSLSLSPSLSLSLALCLSVCLSTFLCLSSCLSICAYTCNGVIVFHQFQYLSKISFTSRKEALTLRSRAKPLGSEARSTDRELEYMYIYIYTYINIYI